MRYTSSSRKEPRNFLKKIEVFLAEIRRRHLMTVTLLVQKVAYIYAVFLEKERFLYLLSVSRIMSYECEKSFRKVLSSFLPKNTKYEKKF